MNIISDPNFNITSDGKIFTRKYTTGKIMPEGTWREVKGLVDKHGYKYLRYFGKQLYFHRIIYAKYGGTLIKSLVINHIDGNTLNNSIDKASIPWRQV